MLSRADARRIVSVEKDFVVAGNWSGFSSKLGGGSVSFTSNGIGVATATSLAVVSHVGGSVNQRVTVKCRYLSPTAAGSENLGALARIQTFDGDINYLYGRVHQGKLRIATCIANVITTLAEANFALPQNTEVTLVFTVIGNALSLTASAAGMTTTTISTVYAIPGASFPQPGAAGFRTLSCTGFFSYFRGELL